MKITKSELREMIREALREELAARDNITEAAISGGQAEGGFRDTSVRPGGSTQPKMNTYLRRLTSKNPDLVELLPIKGKDLKPGMITHNGQVKTTELNKPGNRDKIYIMYTNNIDEFFGLEADTEVMADPNDKTKPFTGDYKDLLKMGLRESTARNCRNRIDESVNIENIFEGLY